LWNPWCVGSTFAFMATGHVEVLKSGFRAVVYAGKDPITGRQSYLKETHPTRDLAVRAKERLVAQVEADRLPDQSATLDHLLRRWLEVADHELSTRETNEGWVDRNPAQYAHPPKLARRRPKPPEPDRVAELINRAWADDPEFGLYLWLAVTTGARRGELAALRWVSCDLEHGELLIEDNYVVRNGEQRIKGTKTDDPRRLSLDTFSVRLLVDFRAARNAALRPAGIEIASDAFVFSPDPAARRPWHPDHFTHAYGKLATAAGVATPLRNLRHFNATQLLSGGVDLRTVAGRLGHSDGGATTLRVYASWTKNADQRAAETLAGDLDELRRKAAAEAPADITAKLARRLAGASLPAAKLFPEGGAASTFRDVSEGIRDALRNGLLEPGALLPTIGEIADRCGLARSTVQRAIEQLRTARLIIRSRGRWIVAQPHPVADTERSEPA
jgi:integrase